MSRLFKRIMLGTLSACLAACILAAGLIFGIGGLKNNNHGGLGGVDGTNNSGSTASDSNSITVEKFDKEYLLKDGDGKTKAQIWDEAISSDNVGKKIKVTMGENWTAVNNTTIFGVAAQTGGSNLLGAPAGTLTIPVGIDMVFDMNGYTLDRGLSGATAPTNDANGNVIHIYGTVIITGDGVITGGMTIGNGGGINAQQSSVVTLNGVTITGNVAWCGGGIMSKGTLVINDALITNNKATNYNASVASGGGVFIQQRGSFTMNGGEISNNEAIYQGGGVALRPDVYLNKDPLNAPKFVMNGGSITNNKCSFAQSGTNGGGGGVAVTYDSTFTLNKGNIDNNLNTVNGSGGGVKVEYGALFEMNGGSVSGNRGTGGPGGGILAENGGKVTINNGNILNNAAGAGCGGGGIFMRDGANVLKFNDGLVKGNTCDGMGGGICVMGDTYASFAGGVITGNKATSFGDGVAASTSLKYVDLCGPLVCYGNGTRDFRLDLGVKINVTGSLIKDGKSAWVSMACADAANGYKFTNGFGTPGLNDGYYASQFFHIGSSSGFAINSVYTPGSNKEATIEAINTRDWREFKWYYEANGSWVLATEPNVRLPYGTEITNVKAEYANSDGTVCLVSTQFSSNNQATKQYKFQKADGQTLDGSIISYLGTGNKITDAGNYAFVIDVENGTIGGLLGSANNTFISNTTLNIQIEPKPVTVMVGTQESGYGIKYDIAENCTVSDLGVTAKLLGVSVYKTYGTDVGTYHVSGIGWTNPNYNVTFVNGTYSIKKRSVTVIINDTYAMYGEVDKSYKLSQTENNVPEQEDGASVQLKDENGDPLFEADGVTPLYKYSGGWRYGKKTDGTASEKFLSVDNTTTNRPFTLVCDDLTAIYDATNNSYLAEGDSYIIKVDAESLNRNYDITFVQDDGSATGDSTSSTSKLKVEGAEISVLSATDYATKKGNGAKGYDGVEYDAKKHKIELPTDKFTGTDSKEYSAGAVQLKGDVGATDVKIHYIIFKNADAPKKDDADDKALMDASNTGKWSGGVTAGTQTEKTDADTYVVYSRIEAKNHKTIVYKWTYKISAKTTAFRLEVYWNTTKIESTDGNAVIPDTDKAKAIYDGTTTATAKIEFVNADGTATGATATTCKTIFYYKNVSPKSDTDNSWKWGAWESTFTRADADQNSPKYKFSDDYNHHEEYGTTEKPKNGGTYTVTVVEDPRSSNGYNLATGGRSLSFTINAKEVEVPYNTDDFTYDGTEQKFGIDGFKKDYMQIVGDPTTSNGEATGLKYDTPNNFSDSESGTDYKLVAKNAGEYKVTFGIKAGEQDNYKWKTTKEDPENPETEIDIEGFNADKTEYELTLTISKVQLKATFTSPQKNIDSSKADAWTWAFEAYKGSKDENGKANALISYVLDETVIVNSESVTVNLRWAVKPATSGTELSPKTTGVIDNKTLNVDNAAFKKDTYYVYLDLPADNDVNKNYQTLVVDETTKLPSELNSNGTGACVQQFVIGDGNASVAGIVWQWKDDGTAWNEYVKNSTDTTTKPNTELTYKLGTDKQAVAYTLQMDTSASGGFPTYFESENITYATTYSKTEKGTYLTALNTTDAGYYKTTVRLKIKSGETIKFVNATDKGYTYVDETQADYTFEWQIGKFKIDPNKTVEFGYKVKDKKTSQLSEFTKFTSVTENGEVIYEVGVQDGGNGIVVAVKLPTDLSAEPYDTSGILKVGTITGKGTVLTPETKQTADGVLLETTIPFSILSGAANNYELAKDADGNSLSSIKIKWRVVASTISAEDIVWSEPDAEDPTKYVDSDGNPTTVSGEVDEIDANGNKTGKKITVTLPAPKLKAGDDKVKYVYVWTDEQGTEHRFEGLQGLYELTGISEREYGGGILPGTVSVKAEPQDGYRMDPSVPEASKETSVVIGDTKIRVRVTPEGELSGTYKEISVTFKVEELDASGNATEYDKELYKLWIYKNGDKDSKVEYSTEELKKLDSGKHTVAIELVNTIGYKIALGSEQFEITVKPVELEIPQLSENPVFNGKDQDILSLLEANETYAAIKELVTVTGQGSAENRLRNVGSYTLVIKINDKVNYVWKNGTTASATKYVLTDGESVPESNRVSDEELNIAWEILPYRIAVTDDMWKTGGKGGAVLNWAIPEGMLLELGYNYYETKTGGSALEKLSEGSSVWASAIITGEDVDNGNVVFADSGTNETLSRVAHTEPKGGLKAFAGTAVDFVKKNWLWFAIGLGVLILLIILIIIIAVARKNKEKRLEKKAAKEEEKQRREEERRLKEEQREEEKRRREEEREAAKAKQEAELELAKARQEAELAKIKAQTAAAAAPAMTATAAMAQQAQQPQQMPQAQPTQQQAQQYQQPAMPQQMPQAQQYQQPVMPQQMQMPMMPQQGGSDIERIISKLEAEFAKLRADQSRSYPQQLPAQGGMDVGTYMLMRLENDVQQLKNLGAGQPQGMPYMQMNGYGLDGRGMNGVQSGMPVNGMNAGGDSAAAIAAAAAAAAIAAMNSRQFKAGVDERKIIEAEASSPTGVDAPTVYPPDAVITTTTTVDTTKKPSAPGRFKRSEEDSNAFDIDGFYESFQDK